PTSSGTSPTGPATTAATRSTRRGSATSAGRPPARSTPAASRTRSSGTAATATGGSRSSRASTGATTPSSTQRGWEADGRFTPPGGSPAPLGVESGSRRRRRRIRKHGDGPCRGRRAAAAGRGRLEERLDRLELEGAREEKALAAVALFALQVAELRRLLDAFADRFQAQGLAELDEGVDEGAGLAGGGDPGDEGAVDLEGVDGELAQVGEGAVAGAEVVDRDPDAERLERDELGGSLVGVAHERRLGDLEGQGRRVEPAPGERTADVVGEGVGVELAGRHVDGDPDAVAAPVPRGRLLARLPEHPAPDRDDEPGLLRNRDEHVRWNDAPAGAAPAEKRL